jgi:signal transduction histidine kinase/CHASE3 domain sensor protein
MRFGLVPRILLVGAVAVALLLVEFVLVLRSLQHVRHLTRSEQRAEQSVVAASRLEKLILDVETGTRGYVITRDRRFLEPSLTAQARLPAETKALRRLAPADFTNALEQKWRSYVSDWSRPVVALAARGLSQAEIETATDEGRRRIDELRGLIDPFVQRQDRFATDQRARIDDVQRNGIVIAVLSIGGTILVFAGMVAYFLRSAVRPLGRIAEGTRRVAAGEQNVEIPEEGAGEIGELAAAFNEMSRALSSHSRELAEQNVDLERLANVLRAVLDSTVDGILLSDASGNVQLANRPVVTLTRELGMSYEGAVVDRLLSVAHRMREEDRYREAMERLRANPDEPTFDEFEDAVSGRVFQGFTAPVLDDSGRPLGRVWTLREVTQQRELDRLKDEFVATVSHELRTPLTSMMGFLEMIREGEAGELTDEQKRFLAIVYRSSERLQRLVGDLLFVARLDAGGLQLQFGEARLDEIVGDAVESSAALARSREVELVAELEDVPPVVGDKERLGQLVGNLVSNALKFTPAGGRVTARSFVDGSHAVIEIADTGIGIPEAEQSRLFQRFFRSSTATEQAIPGTGLGLVISKAIAEAHGGSIGASSKPGVGTCFRVEIPLEPEEVAA